MKLPIKETKLQELLEELGIDEYTHLKDNTVRIFYRGSVIDVWLTTGTFKNPRTRNGGKGIAELNRYLYWIKNNKQKPSEIPEPPKYLNDVPEDYPDYPDLEEVIEDYGSIQETEKSCE